VTHEDNAFVRAMAASPGDMLPQLVYADWLDDDGRKAANVYRLVPLPALACLPPFNGYGGYGGGYDGDGGYGYGDGYGGYGGGYGDGGGGDGGYGGGYGGYKPSRRIVVIENGLYIITQPGGYSPYVLVGEVEINGLDLAIRNARIIRRFGGNQSLAELAANGPASDTQLLAPSPVEYAWRPNVVRAIPCDADKWAAHIHPPEQRRPRRATPAAT
jgi:uncharacterized protein (TIGR02996 family)